MTTTVTPPAGSHFEYEEVKTSKGAETLGQVPILVWDDVPAALAHFGEEGIKNVLDGTSLRVSYQSIARRLKAAKKTDDDIATAQSNFKPGKRVAGPSTPATRAARAAKAATEKVSVESQDLISALLEKIASGALSEADLAALAK